jgi:hypothetical protein
MLKERIMNSKEIPFYTLKKQQLHSFSGGNGKCLSNNRNDIFSDMRVGKMKMEDGYFTEKVSEMAQT